MSPSAVQDVRQGDPEGRRPGVSLGRGFPPGRPTSVRLEIVQSASSEQLTVTKPVSSPDSASMYCSRTESTFSGADSGVENRLKVGVFSTPPAVPSWSTTVQVI